MSATTTSQGAPAEARSSAGRYVAAAALTVIGVLSAAMAGTWRPPLSSDGPLAPPVVPIGQAEAPPQRDPVIEQLERVDLPEMDLGWVWTGLGLVVLSVILAFLGRRLMGLLRLMRRRRAGEDVEGGEVVRGPIVMPSIATLHAGVATAERRLRSHARPVDAVIAAWVALEQAAEESGVAREAAATPTEFTVDVLDRTPADPAATRILLDLYLRARFGDEPVVAADVDSAEAALRTLTRTLAPAHGPAPGPAPGPAAQEEQ